MPESSTKTDIFVLHKQRTRTGLSKVETVGRGHLTFSNRDHKAQFWVADRVMAELHHAQFAEVVVHGLRLIGFEPVDLTGKRYSAQEWWLQYEV